MILESSVNHFWVYKKKKNDGIIDRDVKEVFLWKNIHQ